MAGISFQSKLPKSEISIFSVMSQMAVDNQAINLSQGFPNFETDKKLKKLVNKAMKNGYNQYPPANGVVALREAIAEKIEKLHQTYYDPQSEITVTSGATEALYCAIAAFVGKGDEVIILKPAYDTYEPTVELSGGKVIPIQLEGAEYAINWNKIENAITEKTRMVIINTPHNPTGRIFTEADMKKLESLLLDTDIILLSDEVYEHLIFDDQIHQSASRFPHLAERAVVCASFGKTFHNTGWKTGYCAAPSELMKEIRKIHELTTFSVNHPMQQAYSQYLKDENSYLSLPNFYQQKRDLFLNLIKPSRFTYTPSEGTYFQLLEFSEITDERDTEFAKRLIIEHNLASIPVSVFNKDQKDYHQLRFCFAKTDETLEKAAEILCKL